MIYKTDKNGCKREMIFTNGKYILKSRLVMSEFLQRDLKMSELVHHINGNTLDDRVDNLLVVSRSEHMTIHGTKRPVRESTRKKLSDLNSGEKHPKFGTKLSAEHIEILKRPKSAETRLKMSEATTGKPKSAEQIKNMSIAMKGRTITPEWRAKLSLAGFKRIMSEDSKNKISNANKGKIRTPEQRQRISEAAKNRKPRSVSCQ